MSRTREYLTIEIFIILPLIFLILSLTTILITNGQLDLGDFGLVGFFTLLSSIGTLAAAFAAWRAVSVSKNIQKEQNRQLEESFLPLFEPKGISIVNDSVAITIINHNSNAISIYKKETNNEGIKTNISNKGNQEFGIETKLNIIHGEPFQCVISYRTLNRNKYIEIIEFVYDGKKIEIVDQILNKL